MELPVSTTFFAVVVTYHPDAEFPERLRRIAAQVARVLVVDNHSDPDSLAMIKALCEENSSGQAPVELIANSENRGIAAALNQGMQWAEEGGCTWVLTFDQDSIVSEGLAGALEAVFIQATEHSGPAVAMVGANYRRTADGHLGYAPTGQDAVPSQNWMTVEYVITSGCLLSVEAYTAIGPYREDFFVDYVDIDYCFRARALGLRLLVTCESLMEHSVGAMTPHRFLRTWWVSNYASWRWYYRARNLALTSRAFRHQEPRWVREAWLNLLVSCAKILLFERDKAAKAKNIGRGLWRGLRDRPTVLQETKP